ncbi:MAG TPA: hypothetical protein VHM64_20130, partial [Candidatus Binatia bacterium]|nr:hypothetical protein [Candidatus Binatia bacterium]
AGSSEIISARRGGNEARMRRVAAVVQTCNPLIASRAAAFQRPAGGESLHLVFREELPIQVIEILRDRNLSLLGVGRDRMA